MGKISVGGIVYDNPKQVDQTTIVFPECGDLASPQVPQIDPKTGVPVGPSTRTGKTWQPVPVASGTNSTYGRPLEFPGPACPQPGSYDATPPKAPPLAINQDPPVAGKGQAITVSGVAGSTGNPAVDLVRRVVGQVPNGPAFSNPS